MIDYVEMTPQEFASYCYEQGTITGDVFQEITKHYGNQNDWPDHYKEWMVTRFQKIETAKAMRKIASGNF